MGDAALVESLVTDAITLIGKLDEAGSRPTIAVWYYYDDMSEWQLILAGPTFDAYLPREELRAYRIIVDATSDLNLGSLTLAKIKLMRTDAPLPRALSWIISQPGISRANFYALTLDGLFIKEMLVLRSEAARATTAA